MREETKKVWTKPQLIVVVRGRPEEAVLLACKTNMSGGPSAFPCTSRCKQVRSS